MPKSKTILKTLPGSVQSVTAGYTHGGFSVGIDLDGGKYNRVYLRVSKREISQYPVGKKLTLTIAA